MTTVSPDSLTKGDQATITITRPAHGGLGIGELAGRVVFVRGTYPGDVVRAHITQVKKRYAKADLVEVVEASPMRVPNRCPAASHGAGCCDFADVNPEAELKLKTDILTGQLAKLGRLTTVPSITGSTLEPITGWRTRVRLGVDATGKAGFRQTNSHDLVTTEQCIQPLPGLLAGISDMRFTPGAEVIAVFDDAGTHHIVEVRKPARGKRTQTITKVIAGDGRVLQRVNDLTFRLSATDFWQAHQGAVAAYSQVITHWAQRITQPQGERLIGWDLYGGVGALVPALQASLGPESHIHSVESVAAMTNSGRAMFGSDVQFHTGLVANVIANLPQPDVVVLDPPRVGAGADVVQAVAARKPQCVIHIGCDPAAFATDLRAWGEAGYTVQEVTLVNAFPGTHHFESVGLLQPGLSANV